MSSRLTHPHEPRPYPPSLQRRELTADTGRFAKMVPSPTRIKSLTMGVSVIHRGGEVLHWGVGTGTSGSGKRGVRHLADLEGVRVKLENGVVRKF